MDTQPKRLPAAYWQFTIRTLLIGVAVVSLLLGLLSTWPKHIASYRGSRWQVRPDLIGDVGTAFEVEFSRRWGRTYVDIVPREGLGEVGKAEFIWLEDGKLRRTQIGADGRTPEARIAVTTEWPLVFGVIQYHPRVVIFRGERVSNGGLLLPTHGQCIAADRPVLKDGIDTIGLHFLEQIRDCDGQH